LDYFLAAAHCRAAVSAALQSVLAAELALFRRPELAERRRIQARALASSSLQQLVSILRLAHRMVPRSQRPLGFGSLTRVQLRAARLAAWLSPYDVDAHLALGLYWLERNRPYRAIDPLNRAAQLAPQRGDAWCSLALANAKLFREDLVDAAYAKAMNAIGATSDGFLPDLALALSTLAAATRYIRMETERVARQAKAGRHLGASLRARALLYFIAYLYRLAYFHSGRRLRRWSGSIIELTGQLQQREQSIARLDALINRRRADATRIRRLPQRRAEVSALFEDASDRSQDLKAHYQEAMDHEGFWEAGNAAATLGQVAMRFDRPVDARHWFKKAIELFEPRHPTEIGRRRLHARYAQSLLVIGERGAALDAARLAVKIDPVSSSERDQLAHCHFALSEWAAAREEWRESLRASPDSPVTYHNIALCWYNEGHSADNAAERHAFFTHAATNLDRALSLFATDDQLRLDSQFLLGQIKCTLGNTREGEALWRALESRGYRPLYLGLHLADSMLRERSLEHAQAQFERWTQHVADKAKENPKIMHQNIDGLPGDLSKTTYAASLVWCELGTALAIARRQGGFDDALMHVGNARAAAAEISDEATRLQWLGNCDRIEGEVLLRQGKAAMAVPLFESAILKATNADSYRYLAAALLDQLEPSTADADARLMAMRIKSLLEHAVKLDLDEHIKQPIAELRSRLSSTAAGKAIAWNPA
jgi:Flp pilus assembly protein TadD